ncbi:MAG: urease accessory protein UreJ [Alteromonadaceae bacterium]|nr:MAG: urease accessory protein UreJ [Alteromonadaceae bacterium]
MNRSTIKCVLIAILAVFPSYVMAHSNTSGSGFMAGLLHPVLGLDHLLAMLSVGIISAQFGGRFVWLVPVMFVTFMVIGELLGANGVGIPYVELGIAISVVVLGIGISFAHKDKYYTWLVPLTMLFVVIFGSLHGFAHGVEMPNSASPVYYAFGFIVSTSLIHLVGVLIGFLFSNRESLQRASTVVGVAVAGAGCYILSAL